ncbi:STAS-like domain-containing protein [Methylobacterium sp. WL103]|uniref:STAS-like domain-containing protein n=1 Tax=Methylobacterium sp. WL103 TaxID=2603891 RepID=UPI00164F3516|nr:STAS-like domain-containing protein [Methylobacterium sp. WL103]
MSAMQHPTSAPSAYTIHIATDFTRTPGGRSSRNGKYNGEEFRTRWLEPALRDVPARFERVVVDLDGVDTYIGSFLEEVFGGLLRGTFERYNDAARVLEIKATGEFVVFRDLALDYMRRQDAKNAEAR